MNQSAVQHQILKTEIILYVADQERSREFYEALLRYPPVLHVPGMTEFMLSPSCKLGLMPNDGIAKILLDKTVHPAKGQGIPRCELYFSVADVRSEYAHALQIGARLIAPLAPRDWGDEVGYFADPDGHIIAFAAPVHGS